MTLGSNARKMKAREIALLNYEGPSFKIKWVNGTKVIFSYYDPLLITVRIRTINVKRALYDDSSNAHILFVKAFKRLN